MTQVDIMPPDRADPPMEMWPGRPVNEQDVMAACGHPTDWFNMKQRMYSHRLAWHAFHRSRSRRRSRSYFNDFKWNQMLVFGEYGVGKTTAAHIHALDLFWKGHPVFSNGPTLFGWRLEGNALFTSMGRLPYNAVLLIDEGHAALAGRLSMSTAVGTFMVLSANIRKLNCQMIIMSAQDRNVSRQAREMCVEAWRPWRPKLVEDEYSAPQNGSGRLKPVDDMTNFMVGWDVWDDFPYRLGDIADGPTERQKEGWGRPARRVRYEDSAQCEFVRHAYALTDTFQRVDAGQALLAESGDIKDDVRELSGDPSQRKGAMSALEQNILQVVAELEDGGFDSEYIRATQIARKIGADAAVVGKAVGTLFGVPNVRNKGYPVQEMIDGLADYTEA